MRIDIDDDELWLVFVWILVLLMSPCIGILALIAYLIARRF